MLRLILILLIATMAKLSSGFSVMPRTTRPSSSITVLHAEKQPQQHKLAQLATMATTAAITLAPLAALAEEEYEYGAVDAPIGLAWAAGVVAILTAAVPIVMQGGEEAFEEMKDRDADKWGRGD